MKIAFFWTWDFSRNILSSILTYENIEVSVIVSQPDKPVWRKKEIFPTPVKQLWLEKNIEVLQPETLKNNLDFEQKLKSLNLDFLIVVAYWKIIPKSILDIPKYCPINIHWSILPLYRWASPIQESIKNWDTKTWLTIMKMSEGMDEWDIFEIQEIQIDKDDKTENIFKKFEDIGWPLLVKVLDKIEKNEILTTRQNDLQATYCSKISKQDWLIDFNNDTWNQIYNKYRAYSSWPWVFCFFQWKKLELTDISFEENNSCFDDWFELWDVVEYEDHWENHISILVKWGLLILNKVKMEWKSNMDIFSFINWNKNFLDYNFVK